jgi:large subunit ribosomal protein L4
MPKVKVLNLRAESVGEIDLADDVFGVEVNEGLLYEVLKAQLASKRVGSANTKTRSEVAGSTKKLYKQKGTGRARHGAIRAPNFVGGGQQHGPKPRDYSYRPPAKMRIGALKSALSLKLKEGRLKVVDAFALDEIKTKTLAKTLETLEVSRGSLIVDGVANEKLRLSARNLADHQFLPPEGVNLYDVLRHEHLVLTREAVAALEARCKSA